MDDAAGHRAGHTGEAGRPALRKRAADEQRHVRPRRDGNDEGRDRELEKRRKIGNEAHRGTLAGGMLLRNATLALLPERREDRTSKGDCRSSSRSRKERDRWPTTDLRSSARMLAPRAVMFIVPAAT